MAGKYQVFADGKEYGDVPARKKLRYSKLFVGDYVEYNKEENVIESVQERKNFTIRPPIANIDKLFIVLAPVPQPDFVLIDKLLVQCQVYSIVPILVINKKDLATSAFIKDVESQYKSVVKIYKTTTTDAKTVERLKKEIKGNLCVFVGQSAVGKSSLTNILLPSAFREIGDLSLKTNRGKNCTRETTIYNAFGGKIADTTGFSSLELPDIKKEQLTDCYLEIKEYSANCNYNTCNHVGESENICAVKRAVKEGKIPLKRYERYLTLFKQLKEKQEKKYG